MSDKITYSVVRSMNDEQLAKWLTNIWRAGYATGRNGLDYLSNVPDFYNRLKDNIEEE